MKYLIGFLILVMISCQTRQDVKDVQSSTIKNEINKLQVLLVGTFHFRNFNPKKNRDIVQTNEVDVLTPQNQEELEFISNKISEFNPDKIFVEYPFQKQNGLDSIFKAFSPQNYSTVRRREIQQLAFRIAKKLKHKKVYAYDYRNFHFPYQDMIETMKKANQIDLIENEGNDMKKYEKKYNKIVKSTQSLTAVLYFLNNQKNRNEDLGRYLNSANRAGSVNEDRCKTQQLVQHHF